MSRAFLGQSGQLSQNLPVSDSGRLAATRMTDTSATASPFPWQTLRTYANGGISGMAAWCFVQPIDMVKVRIQLGSIKSPVVVAGNIIRNEGVCALYRGLSAGLLRQATYTTARLGTFNSISEGLKVDGAPLPLWQKAAAGLTAGAVGAVVGSPADLTLIRMQADTTLPVHQRRNYTGVMDAFVRIVREEGLRGLYRGVSPNISRAMALNMGMLASNDQAKEMLEAAGFEPNGQIVILGGATVAGLCAAACSLPFDFVKTRMQEMTKLPDGSFPYQGTVDCMVKTLRNEGLSRFYTGFPTYCARRSQDVNPLILKDVEHISVFNTGSFFFPDKAFLIYYVPIGPLSLGAGKGDCSLACCSAMLLEEGKAFVCLRSGEHDGPSDRSISGCLVAEFGMLGT